MDEKVIEEMPEKGKTWNWLDRSDLKVEMEAHLCAAQEQAIRINYVKYHVVKSIDNLCRMRGKRGEILEHIMHVCKE